MSDMFQKSLEFARKKETPCLVLDVTVVQARFDELKRLMPDAGIYYAIKANADDHVLQALHTRGSCFDVASRFEVDQILTLGISPEKLNFTNTIKKEVDIAYAYERGVRTFTSDALSDIEKLSRAAPGASVMFRLLLPDSRDADVPLSRKFGADPASIVELVRGAAGLGLHPLGVAFHVGSQQRDLTSWGHAIAQAKMIFDAVSVHGTPLTVLNLGGGLPAHYLIPTPEITEYAATITGYLRKHFGATIPAIVVEPGRYLAGDAGVLATEVVMVSRKAPGATVRWVYLDVGKFNGLMETLDEGIKYRIIVEKKRGMPSKETSEVILAGPSCDSADILYEKFRYTLPDNLEEGDRIYFLSAGAYSASMSTVGFNGFPPLSTYVLE